MKYTILLVLSLTIGISAFANEAMSNCVSGVELELASIDEIVTQYFEDAEAPTNSLPGSKVLIRLVCTEELTKKSNKINGMNRYLLDKDEKKNIQEEVQLITDALTNDDTKALTEIASRVLDQRMESSLNKGTEVVIKKARGEAKPYEDTKLEKAIAQYQLSKLQRNKIKSESAH